jgi:hypothetical protein
MQPDEFIHCCSTETAAALTGSNFEKNDLDETLPRRQDVTKCFRYSRRKFELGADNFNFPAPACVVLAGLRAASDPCPPSIIELRALLEVLLPNPLTQSPERTLSHFKST